MIVLFIYVAVAVGKIFVPPLLFINSLFLLFFYNVTLFPISTSRARYSNSSICLDLERGFSLVLRSPLLHCILLVFILLILLVLVISHVVFGLVKALLNV